MDYKRFENTIVARIDRGEEILEQLAIIAQKEQIKLASISALGAAGEITVGVYDVEKKEYHANHFSGDLEIVSLTGNITTKDGQYYAHLHMSAGDEKGQVFGGHLNRAVICATCEMFIQVIDGNIDRQYDEVTGLNVLKF